MLTTLLAIAILGFVPFNAVAHAGAIDPYITRYFDAAEPVALPWNTNGETRNFSAADLSTGKRLFESNCINCHVGGITLPDPSITLSLEDLKHATPPRNAIASLTEFMRHPMTYDGLEETIWCRQVSEDWMTDEELGDLAAFLLRAAEKAPAWASADLFQ
ncbi:photosystem II cytochrome PsbV2 [Leptolyngbya sp. AN02str]|uniref:photosystem II cytochrome PsbV2 n=1 Tax=Leptolyngbya sp. AN02str TaxID=3423363 RepID=UPI003D3226AB